MTELLLLILTNVLLVDYKEELIYQWPGDLYYQVKELRFVTLDNLEELAEGSEKCFQFDQVGPQEVCGTVRHSAQFGLGYYVVVDVE